MRAKDFWKIFPLPAKLKLVWDRLTLTRTTTFYFVFSILHCIVQVMFQVHAFQINVHAAGFLAFITKQGNTANSMAYYVFENDLRVCHGTAPASFSASSCQVIWDGMLENKTSAPTFTSKVPAMSTTRLVPPATVTNGLNNFTSSINSSYPATLTAIEDAQGGDPDRSMYNEIVFEHTSPNSIKAVDTNGTVQVVLNGPGQNNEIAILDQDCLLVLGWPVQILRNTEREDLVFIMFQIWVLGMSIVAILNESVPHLIATLLTHLAATAWTGFQIFSSIRFHSDFAAVTADGACRSVDLLRAYWRSRTSDELSCLVMNCVALLVSAFLCWKLAKVIYAAINLLQSFGWQTFKRVGASLTISRTYKIVLTLSIVIQLSLFFILTSIALWLDQLWNGAIGHLAISPLYRPFLIVTLILLPLWLAFGWYSVRREHKIMTAVFLILCCGYLAGWGAMFDSYSFRWTYMTWPFFAVMTTASVFLTLLAFMLGIICRINFGKGLPHYLKAHEPIEEGFETVIVSDPEKAAFPSSNLPIYAVTLGSGVQGPLQPQASAQNAAQPMTMGSQSPPQCPSRAVIRTPSHRSYRSVRRESSESFVSSSKTWL